MDDRMDQLLHRLPEHRPPAGLARRMALAIRRRQRRRLVIQYSLSAALVTAGGFLFIPWMISALMQVQLPSTGFPLLATTIDVVYNTGPTVSATWDGINLIQANLSQSIGGVEAAGLVLLITGALLGIGAILQNTTSEPRWRSS